ELTQRPELGVMIEVPAAAILAEQLAKHADFLSIGTNDLSQYTLAMDRDHAGLAARVDAVHPALLRLIALTCAGTAKHGRWVGV
ncbi:putative PEP-binding protein, partial [Klebsiella pneumoniae]|uniref:putative PEP-binding protein n=1 Tax=Klebsiella pneumoniae TaxID=573 RepID=UPI00272F76EB